jgi:hypothetical protein
MRIGSFHLPGGVVPMGLAAVVAVMLAALPVPGRAWQASAGAATDARYRQAGLQAQDQEYRRQEQMRQRQEQERHYQAQQREQAQQRQRRVDERQRQAAARGLGTAPATSAGDWQRAQQASFRQAELDRLAFEIQDNRRQMEADRARTDRLRARVDAGQGERLRLDFEQRRQAYERHREALEQQRARLESSAP